MKCESLDCPEDATVHIVTLNPPDLSRQRHFCESHKWTHPPFSDPGGGVTHPGSGVLGGVSRFQLCFAAYFDKRQADTLFLAEITGSKRFSISIPRHQLCHIVDAINGTMVTQSRPCTFNSFAMIIEGLGGRLEDVLIDKIEGNGEFYHTKLKCRLADRAVIFDIRPSDAIGLAIASNVPILIADTVLERAVALGWTQPRERGP